MRLTGRQRQIGEQCLGFPRGQGKYITRGKPGLETAEEGEAQTRHDAVDAADPSTDRPADLTSLLTLTATECQRLAVYNSSAEPIGGEDDMMAFGVSVFGAGGRRVRAVVHQVRIERNEQPGR